MFSIGIAGLNRGASFIGLIDAHPDARLGALCATDPERLASLSEQHDVPAYAEFAELCESDVDAVVVATPPPLHADHCAMALDASKHVLGEVPAVWTIDQGRQLVEAVRRNRGTYMFAENMCYFHYLREMHELVRAGKLGELTYAEAEYIHDLRPLLAQADGMGGGVDGEPSWRASMPPIHYCTHDLGPVLMMMDDRVVSATGLHTGSRTAPELGSIDIEVGLFRTAKGAVVKIMCAFTVARPNFHWICLYGTLGSMEMDRFDCSGKLMTYFSEEVDEEKMTPVETGLSDPNAPSEATGGGHGTSEYFMMDDFVRSCLDDTDPPFDVYTGLDYTLPGICAHLSAESGGAPVEVPDPRDW